MIRAALHLHSTFSDGEFTIAELRELFLAAGCRVIAMTDHADAFTDAQRDAYIGECARCSDERLLVLPGLEFGCEQRMHIIGYGVTALTGAQQPEVVIRHIADAGGVSVIAHPKTVFFEWIRGFALLPDGIEAWNSKYDGRLAPRPETFALIRELRTRKPALRGFYGIDLHWRKQFRGLLTEIELDGATIRETVLDALREGRFEGTTSELRLPSSAVLDAALAARFAARHRNGQRLRSALRRVKHMTDALGIRPPAALKARLRRFF